jgi:hypothetical protein
MPVREALVVQAEAMEDGCLHIVYVHPVAYDLKTKMPVREIRKACKERRIWIYGGEFLRVSTHIHTRREDLDALFLTMRETLG